MQDLQRTLRRLLVELDLERYVNLEKVGEVDNYLQQFINGDPFPTDQLTAAIYPSRFSYLKDLLEQEFFTEFLTFINTGILNYELLNLCEICLPVFMQFDFPIQEDDRFMRYAIIGQVAEYLKGGVAHGV